MFLLDGDVEKKEKKLLQRISRFETHEKRGDKD